MRTGNEPCAGDKCAHVRRKPVLREAGFRIESWQHLPEDEMLHSNIGITFRPLFLTNSHCSQASLRLIPAFLLILILLSPAMAHAQGNYVYVNNQDVANSISGFAVSFNGN